MLTSDATKMAALETLKIPRRMPRQDFDSVEMSFEDNDLSRESSIARSVAGTADMTGQRVVHLPPVSGGLTSQSINLSNSATQQKQLLSAKAKMLISAYLAVVLVFVMGIALALASINALNAEIASLTNQLATQVADVAALEESVALLEDEAAIESIASSVLGLTKPNSENTTYFESPKTRAAQNYHVDRNWFDKLCNWLGGIVGG